MCDINGSFENCLFDHRMTTKPWCEKNCFLQQNIDLRNLYMILGTFSTECIRLVCFNNILLPPSTSSGWKKYFFKTTAKNPWSRFFEMFSRLSLKCFVLILRNQEVHIGLNKNVTHKLPSWKETGGKKSEQPGTWYI